ncbi:ribosomal protein S5 domain 2-type protein [Apodospora peruviana]|uniref:Small ribosomal subunit protein uS9m n=1 Tax=Apodospora peruviana TaxID=516989 RepID=A0AAE0IJ41_9PEZI|nr:ribosomal protein S5 domain 2-type protein [Apodospora peruviana]
MNARASAQLLRLSCGSRHREKLLRNCSAERGLQSRTTPEFKANSTTRDHLHVPQLLLLSAQRPRDNDEEGQRRTMMASFGQHITGALRGSCLKTTKQGGNGLRGLEQQFTNTLRLGPTVTSRRCMTTQLVTEADFKTIQAAPHLDLNALRLPSHARPVPVSPSYFSRTPRFNDSYLAIQKLLRSYDKLPMIPSTAVERVTWCDLETIRRRLGEPVRASDYSRCLALIKKLHSIHPQMKPGPVKEALEGFKRSVQGFQNVAKPIPIDRFGRAVGVGKRKSSVARAWVVEGTGEVQINGKSLAGAFGRVHDRESAIWALRATDRVDKYNVWALVEGGGTTGQAEALTLAISKALMAHEPALKPALRRAGCVTRDPRKVERKKAGHLKARKSPTWVKR